MKKTHIYLYVSLLVFLFGCEITDADSADPQDTFVKYYGINGVQVGIDLEYDARTESLIILGSEISAAGDGVSRDVVVRRVDLGGNELASRVLDFTGKKDNGDDDGGDDVPSSILVEDDGFVIVGTTSRDDENNNPYSVIFIVRLDEELDSISSMELEATVRNDNNNVTEGYDLKGMDIAHATTDGAREYVITGSSNFEELGDPFRGSDNIPEDETQIFLARIDIGTGTTIWRRTRGFRGDDEGIYIDEFARDNFVIIGTSEKVQESQGKNVLLLPVNELASPNDGLARGFPINNDEGFDDVAAAVFKRPAGYVVTGTSSKVGENNRPFFINFTYSSSNAVNMDSGREVVIDFDETTPSNLSGNGNAIALGRNGNYVLVGEYLGYQLTSDQGKNSEILVTQLDQSGNDLQGTQKNYGLVAGNDIGEDLVVLPSGDLIVLSTVDFGSGNTLIGLMRLNRDGDIAQ